MLTNYKILIKKYRFPESQALKDINLFTSTGYYTLESTLEIPPNRYWIDEDTKIESNTERDDFLKNVYYLKRQTSNIEIKLSDLSGTLRNFFEIYSDTSYLRYRAELYTISGNEKVWDGVVTQDSINALFDSPQNNSADNEVIKLTLIGLDKEFKDYYKQLPLPSETTLVWHQDSALMIKYGSTTAWSEKAAEYLYLSELMSQLFPNAEFLVDEYIADWRISRDGFIRVMANLGNSFVMVKLGYKQIADNNENRYDFISKLCYAMGWDFFYHNGYFVIQDKSKENAAADTYDYGKFEGRIEVSKDAAHKTFEHIIIKDGKIRGNPGEPILQDVLYYNKFQILSTIHDKYSNIPFTKIKSDGYLQYANTHKCYAETDDDEDGDRYKFNLYAITTHPTRPQPTAYEITRSKILFIDGGDTGNCFTRYERSTGINVPAINSDIAFFGGLIPGTTTNSNMWLNFNGHYGNICYKYARIGLSGQWVYFYYTYDMYYLGTPAGYDTNKWSNNFQRFFSGRQRVLRLKATYSQMNHSQKGKATIINGGDLNGDYGIERYSLRLGSETTELEFIKLL